MTSSFLFLILSHCNILGGSNSFKLYSFVAKQKIYNFTDQNSNLSVKNSIVPLFLLPQILFEKFYNH